MRRPFEVHLLEALQGLNGPMNGTAERVLVLVVTELQYVTALAIKLSRPASAT
jgi:hypothetical protein